jgi:hypothetical protein
MSQAPSREPVYLKDYRPPAFTTREVELTFELDPDATVVTSRQAIERNPQAAGAGGPDELVLFGESQELLGWISMASRWRPTATGRRSDRLGLRRPARPLRARRALAPQPGREQEPDGPLRL